MPAVAKKSAFIIDEYEAQETLRKIIRANLRGSEKDHRQAIREKFAPAKVFEAHPYLCVIFDYWFRNTYARIDVQAETPLGSVVQFRRRNNSKQLREHFAKEIQQEHDAYMALNLMDIDLPSGVKVRNATGAQMTKFGKWGVEVGRIVGPAGIVHKRMTVAELANVYRRFHESKK